MTWKPASDIEAAVRAWMKARGWKVDDYENNTRKRTYLWIHYPVRSAPIVLGISQEVLTSTPLFAIQELLDRLNVAAELKARPGIARVLVRRDDRFVLEDFVRE